MATKTDLQSIFSGLLQSQADAKRINALQNVLINSSADLPNPVGSGIGIGSITSGATYTSLIPTPSPYIPHTNTCNIPIEALEKYVKTDQEYVKLLELLRDFIDKWGDTQSHHEED